MTSPIIKIFSIIIGVLTIYAIPCFLAHYLDFGWKFASGEWFHKKVKLVKKMRSGLFHKILIGFILTILIYASLSEVFTVIPEEWGQIGKKGEFQPYRRILAPVLAIILGVINLYAFNVAETYFAEKEKAIRRDEDISF